MINTFLNELNKRENITRTENGGITRKSTESKVLDLFALGGSFRTRTEDDIILLFKNAFEEDKNLALKCLFYLRDIRGGQGERRFFRVAFKWLCNEYPDIARKNLENLPEYGRYDDLIYATDGTPVSLSAFTFIKHQLALDIQCKTPSLLAKWLPSINASNAETKRLGRKLAKFLSMTEKQYRKTLSVLRERINVLERLMSAGKWDEIEFDKIPSRAGLIYKNAFARRDIIAQKYETFAKNKSTKVNAEALYPQDVAHMAFRVPHEVLSDNPERLMIQKYWDNLRDFYNGREENGIAVVDVSGSMSGVPMEAAVSLGAYVAEKGKGPFANHFITFSNNPQLIRFEGVDIVDKFCRCRSAEWGMTTNIQAVFDLLLSTAKKNRVRPEDIPSKIYIFSDMEFNQCVTFNHMVNKYGGRPKVATSIDEVNSDLENIKAEWKSAGYVFPKVIFWNLDARHNVIPAIGNGFSYVSGFSPSMVECLLSGKDGYDVMLDKLVNSGRYDKVTV